MGTTVGSGTTQTVSATATGLNISGGDVIVVSGGVLLGANVIAGGQVLVSSGGLDSSASINASGTETVFTGGSALGATVFQDGVQIVSGGLAGGTTLFGGTATVAGGTFSGGNVIVNGSLTETGGTVVGTTIDGGSATLAGAASDVVIGLGGLATVFGAAQYSLISGAGIAYISGGGTETSATILSNGQVFVSSGGVTRNDFVGSNGEEDVRAGGVASAISVGAGGGAFVEHGGSIAGALVSGAVGLLQVDSGGVALAATVSAGGLALVQSLGLLQDADVLGGGDLAVAGGGTISGAALGNGGTLNVESGGIASGTIGFTGGGLLVFGADTTPGATVGGLGAGDTVGFAGLGFATGGTALVSGGVLSVTEGGTTDTVDLAAPSVTGHALTLAAFGSGGTAVEVACFAEGTRIATPDGEVPVEALRPGDDVRAWQHGIWGVQRVRWVGHSRVELARHPRPEQVAPVRIRAHAVAPDMPRRDVLLSPDHAVLLDGRLVQAQALQNGATVMQIFPPHIVYWHVELDCHTALLAEGLPAESYLDTGNRALFAGDAGVRALFPDLASAAAWNTRACAPLHLTGPVVTAAHARLLLRAVECGHALVADPALRILADGREVLGFAGADQVWQAMLPAGTRTVRLLSRSFVPAWFAKDDRRRLGVAVRRLHIGGRALPHDRFGHGWHAAEPEWRWTDGDADLNLAPPRRAARLTLTLAPAGARYWADPAADAQRRTG